MWRAVLLALQIAVCADVERAFEGPKQILENKYSFEFAESSSTEIEGLPFILNNQEYICQLPLNEKQQTRPELTNDEFESAKTSVLSLARDHDLYFDDIWGWDIWFAKGVKQMIPRRVVHKNMVEMILDPNGLIVGQPQPDLETNLLNSTAVWVDNRYMLKTEFINGSLCDLTMKPRKMNLFLTCLDTNDRYQVLSMEEPQSNCIYELTVGVPQLCKLPSFRPAEASNKIVCYSKPEEPEEPEEPEPEPEPEDIEELKVAEPENVESQEFLHSQEFVNIQEDAHNAQ